MAVLRYNGYYVSVFHTPDRSGNSSCIPFVEISHKRDHGPATRLMLNEAFTTAQDGAPTGLRWASNGSMRGSLKVTLRNQAAL